VACSYDAHVLMLPKRDGEEIRFYNLAIGEQGNSQVFAKLQKSPISESDAKNWQKSGKTFTRKDHQGKTISKDIQGLLSGNEMRWFWASKTSTGTIEIGKGFNIGQNRVFEADFSKENDVEVVDFMVTSMC